MEFNSERYFTIFDFFISHGQLLLRASRNEAIDSNIDIIFFDVHFIQLKTYFKGITIKKYPGYGMQPDETIHTYIKHKQLKLFEIESENERYYIAASLVQVFENKLEFGETSVGVIQFKGRDKLIFEINNL